MTEAETIAGLPGEWLRPGGPRQRGLQPYLHGGAYVRFLRQPLDANR